MLKPLIVILSIILSLPCLSAQDSLSQKIDSLPPISLLNKKEKPKKSFKNYWKKDYPSPKKAVLLAVVPGMGQIYNKKYWKLPLVYGALGGLIYSIRYNTREYNKFQNALNIRSNSDCQNVVGDIPTECIEDAKTANLPTNAVQAGRNSFDKNRQLSWIGIIGFYLISAGDALVDAHLKDFSVDDDISFVPIFESNYNNQPTLGIGIRYRLSK